MVKPYVDMIQRDVYVGNKMFSIVERRVIVIFCDGLCWQRRSQHRSRNREFAPAVAQSYRPTAMALPYSFFEIVSWPLMCALSCCCCDACLGMWALAGAAGVGKRQCTGGERTRAATGSLFLFPVV